MLYPCVELAIVMLCHLWNVTGEILASTTIYCHLVERLKLSIAYAYNVNFVVESFEYLGDL
jgi:hypothetical protein